MSDWVCRWIDAEFVIRYLTGMSKHYDAITLEDMIKLLEMAASNYAVDARLVVRCRNCANYCSGTDGNLERHCMLSGMVVDGEDYCSYGVYEEDA